MSDLEHKTTRQLIDRVNSQNHRFRLATVVFGAATLLGLLFLVIICLSTLTGVNNQLSQQKKLLDSQQQILSRISASSQQRTKQINDLQNHIDCIVNLFQHPNRADLTIGDLQDCTLTSNPSISDNATSNGSTPSSQPDSTNTAPKQDTPTKSNSGSTLDRIPGLGRVFKALGL
jgi:type II secretory pathway pseudopilin PulG